MVGVAKLRRQSELPADCCPEADLRRDGYMPIGPVPRSDIPRSANLQWSADLPGKPVVLPESDLPGCCDLPASRLLRWRYVQGCEHMSRLPDVYWLGDVRERTHVRANDNVWNRADVRGRASNLREYGLVRFAHEHMPGVANLQRR